MRRDEPQAAVCDVHWAWLAALRPHHLRLLDGAERDRRAAYLHDRDRDRFALGAALLRIVVGTRTDVAPDRVRIDRTCSSCGEPHGRPRIADEPVEVSVSHSGDVAAIAVTDGGPVGIDVEAVRQLQYRSLLDEVCAGTERGWVRSVRDFFVYWTRKESVLKAVGVGLDVPMSGLVVTPPNEPPRLLAYREGAPISARMADVAPSAGYSGAVTVLTTGPVVFREHLANALLAHDARA